MKKMGRRMMSVLLVLVMCLGMVPAVTLDAKAAARDVPAGALEVKTEQALTDALTKAVGSGGATNISLSANITITAQNIQPRASSEVISIYGNGYTITANHTNIFYLYGNLTKLALYDMTLCGNAAAGLVVLSNTSSQQLTMENVTVNCTKGNQWGTGLYVSANDKVSLTDCTFNGTASMGYAAIINIGTLTMTRCTVTGATKGAVNNTGTLVAKECNFYNNSNSAAGGAIESSGDNSVLILDGCSFTGNRAGGGTGSITGGAVDVRNSGKLYANNTVFANNLADCAAGIYSYGAGTYLMNCTITGNIGRSSTYKSRGQGMDIYDAPTHAVNCLIVNNYYGPDGNVVDIANSSGTIQTNQGNVIGRIGASSTINYASGVAKSYVPSVTIDGNTYNVSVPVLVSKGDNAYAKYVPILGNATTQAGCATYFTCPESAANISGLKMVYAYKDDETTKYKDLIANTEYNTQTSALPAQTTYFESNTTRSAPYVIGASAAASGTLYQVKLGTYSGCTVTGLSADGGWYFAGDTISVKAVGEYTNQINGWRVNGTSKTTGATYTYTVAAADADTNDVITLTPDVTVRTVTVSDLDELTDALKNEDVTTIIVTKAIALTDGTELNGKKDSRDSVTVRVATPHVAEGEGLPTESVTGASTYNVFTIGANVTATVKNMTVIGGSNGNGAIYVSQATGKLTMENVTVTRSYSGLNVVGSAELKNCVFTRNFTTSIGGALYVGNNSSKATVVLDGCSFTYNNSTSTTNSHGGSAIWIYGGSSTVYANNCVFAGNKAVYGGAVRPYDTSSIYLMNCTIAGNMTTTSNTNIYAGITKNTNGSKAYAVNCVIADNYCGNTQSNSASLTGGANNYIAANSGTAASGFAASYDGLYPVLTDGKYVPVSGAGDAAEGGVAKTYFDYSDLTAVKMGYKVNASDAITALTATAPTTGKVTTYYEGTDRVAGVIGASAAKPAYNVTLGTVTGGSVSAPKKAIEDATVTLTLNPDPAYTLQTLTVKTTVDNETVQTAKVNDTTYTFTMPAEAVTVTAAFAMATESTATIKLVSTFGDTADGEPGLQSALSGTGGYANVKYVVVTDDITVSASLAIPDGVTVVGRLKNGSYPTLTLAAGMSITHSTTGVATLQNLNITSVTGYGTTNTNNKISNTGGTLIMKHVGVTGEGRGVSQSSSGTKLILDGCSFCENKCNNWGSALYIQGGTLYANNTVIANNIGDCWMHEAATTYFVNCTAVGNKTSGGAGSGVYLNGGSVTAANCIFMNNGTTANAGANETGGEFNHGTPTLYNCVSLLGLSGSTTSTLANVFAGGASPLVAQGAYGKYAPLKSGGGVATYFDYDASGNVYMSYGDASPWVSTLMTKPAAVSTYYEGGARTGSVIGASAAVNVYTVTFMNGEETYATQTVVAGGKATAPTNPTKNGSTFVGWYSDAALTSAYDFTAAVNNSITLYAAWKYNVTVGSITHGSVTADKESAKAGETVTLSVSPNANYQLHALTYNDGSEHNITEAKSFTMPASAVTVSATFDAVISPVTVAGLDAPSKGVALDTAIEAIEGVSYALTWYEGYSAAGDAVTGDAKANQIYTVKLVLTAADGYVFGSSVTAENYAVTRDNDTQITLTKTFEATTNRAISSIAVTTVPDKTAYVHGDTFETAGMVVTATYDDSTTVQIQDYSVSYTNGRTYLKKGETTVTITADNSTTTQAVTVGAKPLTVSGLTAADRPYDGTANVTLSGGALVGVVSGETVAATFPTTGTIGSADVGENKSVTFNAVTISGADAENYTITQPTVTVNISAKSIRSDMIALGAQAIYDGTEKNVVIASVKDGTNDVTYTVISGDKATDVGSNTLTITGNGNYAGTTTATWTLQKATPAAGDFNITTDLSRDYTGSAVNVTAPTTVKAGMGAVTVKYAGGATAPTNVGEYAVTFDVAEGANYTAATGLTIGTLTINRIAYSGTTTASATVRSGQPTTGATLTLPALPAGASYATSGTVSNSDFITAHSISDMTLTYSTASQDAGTSATITIHVSGATNYNEYDVIVTVTAKAKDPANASITGGDQTVIYGDAGFFLTGAVTAPGNDGAWTWSSSDIGVATIDSHTGAVSIVGQGVVTITAKYESDTTIGEATMKLTVNRAALTVTANNNTITYGDAPSGNGVTYSGWKKDDTESSGAVTGSPSYSYDYSQYDNVGSSYKITPSGLSAANYEISYAPGTLTVQQKEVGLEWTNTALTYDTTEQVPTAAATGTVNGDTISVAVTGGQTNAGAYTATASGLTGDKAGNYRLPSVVTQGFTIGKAAQSTPPTISSVTDEGVATLNEPPAEDNAVQYVINIDTISDFTSVVWQNATLDAGRKFTVDGTSPSTSYYLYVRYAESANYNASAASASASFTTPATCTVTFEANGGSEISPITGVVSGATVAAPTAPTMSGYTFGGWYKDSGLTTAWDFSSDTVTANITLYAKWTPTTIPVTGVTLDRSALSLTRGSSATLTATVVPDDATNKAVTWSSSNTSVATVSSGGTVTTVAAGTATITVTTADGGYTATCAVTVSAPYIPPTPSYDDSDSSDDYTPPTTTTTSANGTSVSVSVSGGVSGGVATVTTASAAALERSVTAGDISGAVELDMSGVSGTVTAITVPASTVKAIEQAVSDPANAADTLAVTLSAGSVTFDADALDAIADQTRGSSLRLDLEAIAISRLNGDQRSAMQDLALESAYSVHLSSGSATISDFRGGTAEVEVRYTLRADQDARWLSVWHVATDGARTRIPSTYENGRVRFTAGHFSNYVIAYDEAMARNSVYRCEKDYTCPISTYWFDSSPTAWYHDGVHWALESGVMGGYSAHSFAPNDGTTRAMVVTMLWRLDGSPQNEYENPFYDVSDSDWSAQAILWARNNGIASGNSPHYFGPDDAITREQLAIMLYNYARYKGIDVSVGEDTNILSYGDAFDLHEYAFPAVQWAVGAGIMTGMTNGTREVVLAPHSGASRAIVATMLMRYCMDIAE